jgi:hypothetical protein
MVSPPRLRHDVQAFPRRFMSAGRLGFVIGLIGLVVTGSVAWTARDLNRSNEDRLLQVQTAQAGALIASSILGIEAPLATSSSFRRPCGR